MTRLIENTHYRVVYKMLKIGKDLHRTLVKQVMGHTENGMEYGTETEVIFSSASLDRRPMYDLFPRLNCWHS